MKNLKFKFTAFTLAVATLFSCNNLEEQSYDVKQVKVTQEDNLIERNILNLSSVDASKLAKQFSINEYEGGSRTASDVAIKDIQTIASETGEPLIYVVNYANDKGFTVISATKNYAPVLAYSEEGYLNVNDESFTNNIFMEEYKTYIGSVVNVRNDSLRQRYAIDWSFYEKKPEAVYSRAYTDSQIQQELNNARTYYTNQGYEIHSLNAATSLIQGALGQTGEERASGFIRDICEHTPQQYDCMDVTLLLVKRIYHQYGPYIQDSWHQFPPFNTDSRNIYAGCATIAVAKVMNYHQWPIWDNINWNNIREDYLISLNTDEWNLFSKLRKEMNANDSSPTETTISNGDMINFLSNNGYTAKLLDYPGYLSVGEHIIAGRPVIMRGNKSQTSGHAWVCDGYKYHTVQYAAYMIDRDFGEYTFFPGMTDYSLHYLHMSWGDDPEFPSQAWYYQDNLPSTGNYTIARKIITVKPNK